MKIADLQINWPKTIALSVLTFLLFWAHACKPEVASLVNPGVKITRPELQIELNAIIATAEYRLAELDKQQRFQDIIFKNALLMAESGSMNPMGVLTLLAGLYGIARGTQDLKEKVKKANGKT